MRKTVSAGWQRLPSICEDDLWPPSDNTSSTNVSDSKEPLTVREFAYKMALLSCQFNMSMEEHK